MENNKIDTFSKLYCTVNKPIYCLINMIIIAPLICASNLSTYDWTVILSYGIIGLFIVLNIVQYIVCKKIKLKHNKLNIHKVSIGKKIVFVLLNMWLMLFSVVVLSFMSIGNYLK